MPATARGTTAKLQITVGTGGGGGGGKVAARWRQAGQALTVSLAVGRVPAARPRPAGWRSGTSPMDGCDQHDGGDREFQAAIVTAEACGFASMAPVRAASLTYTWCLHDRLPRAHSVSHTMTLWELGRRCMESAGRSPLALAPAPPTRRHRHFGRGNGQGEMP